MNHVEIYQSQDNNCSPGLIYQQLQPKIDISTCKMLVNISISDLTCNLCNPCMLRYYYIITLPPILILRPCATNLLTFVFRTIYTPCPPPSPQIGGDEIVWCHRRSGGACAVSRPRQQTNKSEQPNCRTQKTFFTLVKTRETYVLSWLEWEGFYGAGGPNINTILAFHPLWQQELTTTRNWGTKTNLGFGRPVS